MLMGEDNTEFKIGGIYNSDFSYYFMSFIDANNNAYIVNIDLEENQSMSNKKINEIFKRHLKSKNKENKLSIVIDEFDYLNYCIIRDGYLGQIDNDVLELSKNYIYQTNSQKLNIY